MCLSAAVATKLGAAASAALEANALLPRLPIVPLGSMRGSIVAADERGEMHMHLLDLVSGARKSLPAVATRHAPPRRPR